MFGPTPGLAGRASHAESQNERIGGPVRRYRSDIDGLRAIAVLPVILFHFGVPLFSGGYVGADLFFVISGYLITAILMTEIQSGHFSILGF